MKRIIPFLLLVFSANSLALEEKALAEKVQADFREILKAADSGAREDISKGCAAINLALARNFEDIFGIKQLEENALEEYALEENALEELPKLLEFLEAYQALSEEYRKWFLRAVEAGKVSSQSALMRDLQKKNIESSILSEAKKYQKQMLEEKDGDTAESRESYMCVIFDSIWDE